MILIRDWEKNQVTAQLINARNARNAINGNRISIRQRYNQNSVLMLNQTKRVRELKQKNICQQKSAANYSNHFMKWQKPTVYYLSCNKPCPVRSHFRMRKNALNVFFFPFLPFLSYPRILWAWAWIKHVLIQIWMIIVQALALSSIIQFYPGGVFIR